MDEPIGSCWHCGQPLLPADYAREGQCPACRRHTHVCRNCRFYRPGLSNDCQEPVAEHVADKTRANFCDYFSATRPVPEQDGDNDDALRAAAEALFNPDD